ncbi:MAG TPA: magnesium transporter, partial [Nitrospiria bacterium]|nr:magnesium transporter [Nitrospiria bacterium]
SISIQDILVASRSQRIGDLAVAEVGSVHAMAEREEVVEMMERSRLTSLPVLDFEGHFLGAIRQEAFVTAAHEEASMDIQTMVGVSKEERAFSPVGFAVRKRLPWLHVNLATAFLAAAVVGIFEGTIARFTALAVLLPVVAGQAGNTGAQALAITMRGLALHEVRTYQWTRLFFKELRVAFVNGVGVALSTSFFVFLWSGSAGLSLIIGASMVISMVAAGVSGVVIPVFLSSIGQDPAQSSSIILTTVTDVVGFLSFLGFATVMAGLI